ncbi:NAD(P)-dependent alcohol dehydrogenase [Fodinibacter luteus]|uniref:NAD(P)-dependent alcohol dehydrogenase n=1 Tax=Fodinibacter luteus TaxID=552064 RepID=A0ABP8K8B5_9MICO
MSERYGPPEVVRVRDGVEVPFVGPDDVLVQVRATTVNRTDCSYRGAHPFFMRGVSGVRRPRTSIWGTEYAGVVERVGREVTRFAPGDEVFGYAEGRFGAHAEYVAVSVTSLVAAVPTGVDLQTAAASTEGGHYALSAIRRAGLEPGQRVLVNGGTGAIGSAAVQLLADLGAHVTATAPTAHVELVRGLGAADVVDHETHDFTRTGRTYDAVLDMVGKSTFQACRRILVPGGVYVSSDLGPFAQNLALPLATRVGRQRRRRVVFPLPIETPEALEYLRARLESGAYRPVLDRTYPLEDIVDAYRYVESGRKVGNVVIAVRDR